MRHFYIATISLFYQAGFLYFTFRRLVFLDTRTNPAKITDNQGIFSIRKPYNFSAFSRNEAINDCTLLLPGKGCRAYGNCVKRPVMGPVSGSGSKVCASGAALILVSKERDQSKT